MVKNGWIRKAVLLVVLVVLAVGISTRLLAAGEPASTSPSSIWKVSSGRSTVYLLGSIHFLRQDSYPLPAAMERALADAGVVVFEMDVDDTAGENNPQQLLTRGMYPQGRTLRDSMARDTYDLLQKKSASLGLDVRRLETFKPWFVTLTLLSLKLQMSGFTPDYGIDQYFLRKARKSQKEILTLETLKDQIDIFDELSDRDQEALILQTLHELDTMDAEINRLVAAWRNGDGTAMAGMILESYRDYPVIYDRLIVRRNRKWLGAIERFLRQKTTVLVIVGAGHLIGDDGLIGMLREKGYTVEQL